MCLEAPRWATVYASLRPDFSRLDDAWDGGVGRLVPGATLHVESKCGSVSVESPAVGVSVSVRDTQHTQ